MLRKILAVDDSALIHQMYKLFLSRYKSCKLISAMNGLEALDKLGQEEGIDLILLDINMPVMNGLEFLQRVQKEPAYQAIPVIIISTEGKEEDTIRGLKMGAKGYVKKPFQASELHGLIEKITTSLRRGRGRPPDSMSDFQVSPELLAIYLEDARQHLEALDHCLLTLEREGADAETIAAVLGPLHTLKGNSGMIGFSAHQGLRPPARGRLRARARRGARPRAARPSTACSRAPPRCATPSSRPGREGAEARDLGPERADLERLVASGAAVPAPPRRPGPRAASSRPRRSARPGRASASADGAPRPASGARTSRYTARSSVVRVEFAQLDHLLNLVGELIIHRTKLQDMAKTMAAETRPSARPRATCWPPCTRWRASRSSSRRRSWT